MKFQARIAQTGAAAVAAASAIGVALAPAAIADPPVQTMPRTGLKLRRCRQRSDWFTLMSFPARAGTTPGM